MDLNQTNTIIDSANTLIYQQNTNGLLYTPSGDQPMGEQEMKIRGVHW